MRSQLYSTQGLPTTLFTFIEHFFRTVMDFSSGTFHGLAARAYCTSLHRTPTMRSRVNELLLLPPNV